MLPRLLVMAVVAAVAVWPRPSPGQTEDPGPIRIGDRWTYETKDTLTGDIRSVFTVVVADITEKEITTRLNYRGKPRPRTVVFTRQWGVIDDSVWQHRPSLIGLRTPLHLGKQWRSRSISRNLKTGIAFRNSAVAKVVGREKTTTPAGTFDTYRVEVKLRQVNSRDQTKSATQTYVYWYAPAINCWTKKRTEIRFAGRLRDSHTNELIKYSRKP